MDTGGSNGTQFRLAVFFGAFGLLFAAYGLTVGPFYLGDAAFSGGFLQAIGTYGPTVKSEFSIPAEVVPTILGGVLAWAAPGQSGWLRFFALLLMSGLAYVAYLHLGTLLDPENSDGLMQALVTGDASPEKAQQILETVTPYASAVRNFSAATVGALVGFKYNPSVGHQRTETAPEGNPANAP